MNRTASPQTSSSAPRGATEAAAVRHLLRQESNQSESRAAFGLFKRYLAPYWKRLLVIAAVNVAIGFLISARPLVLAPALDYFVESEVPAAASLSELSLNNLGPTLIGVLGLADAGVMALAWVVALILFLVVLATAALNMLGHVVLVGVRTGVSRDMKVALHRHMVLFPLGYFVNQRAGDMVSRMTNDVNVTANSLDTIARGILQALAQVSLSLVVLFSTDAQLALLVLGLGSIHLVITRLLATLMKTSSREMVERNGALNAGLLETFVGIRMIKSFAAERYDARRVRRMADDFRQALSRIRIVTYYQVPIRMIAHGAIVSLVLVLVFHAVDSGRLTLAAAALFFFMAQQLSEPISNLFTQILGFHSVIGSATRIIDTFNHKSGMPDGSTEVDGFRRELSVKDVSFAYRPGSPVLRDVSFTVPKGEFVALVGPSGSGKTTLADLVLRLYDVDAGEICLDGVDIRRFRQRQYRKLFGVVSQESLLFNDSVRENIVYNQQEDAERIAHAVWCANAAEFIEDLPEGLDTVVGDRGVQLSGGQRQRIGIARAVYGRPAILVLDEATSALDSESELAVQAAIERVSREMTVIAIAHRLSTVRNANRIVVLNQGLVEAQGTHEQLLETSVTYRRLCEIQFSGEIG